MKAILLFTLLFNVLHVWAQDNAVVTGKETQVGNKKVIYTYKQFEKFDFDDLNIEGDTGNPVDLSVSPIHAKGFSNRLPYRKSFTVEIKRGIERVR